MEKITGFFVFSLMLLITFSCADNNRESVNEENMDISETSSMAAADIKIPKYDEVITDYYDNGNVFTVEYFEKDGNFESPIFKRKYFRTGKLFMEGGLKEGKREGNWTAWYENGNIWSIASYSEGLRNGEGKVYYDNGQLRYIQAYDMDTPQGLWKFYCPEGNLLGEIMYESGVIVWENNYMEGN